MHPHDPSANGGMAPKPDQFDMELEPIDPSELQLDNVPTVEPVRDVEGAPLRKPGFSFGKAILWCLLAMAVSQGSVIVILIIALVGGIFFEGVQIPTDQKAALAMPFFQSSLQVSIILGHLLSIGFCLLILRWSVGKQWQRKIAFRLPSMEHVILVLVGLPALMMVLIPIERLIQQLPLPRLMDLEEMFQSWPVSIAILAIGVGPAIWEELFFRGFLGQGIAARYGRWPAVFIVSFLFGALHIEPRQAIGAMMLGVVLHLTYLATRSILIPIMIHFLNNSLAVLSVTKTLPLLDALEAAYDLHPTLALTSASSVLAMVSYLLYRSRARIPSPADGELPPISDGHVELPQRIGVDAMDSGSLAMVEIGLLIVIVGIFAAVWFGI